jgi:hypothetical protein
LDPLQMGILLSLAGKGVGDLVERDGSGDQEGHEEVR